MLAYALLIGLVIGACYIVLNPLLHEDDFQDDLEPKPEDILEKLKKKKDGAYAAIREMEFDLKMGKLTEEDFNILKRQYLEEAAGYMKAMDELEEGKDAASATEAVDSEEELSTEVTAGRTNEPNQSKYIYCTSCGKKATVGSRFCTDCGTSLKTGRVNP